MAAYPVLYWIGFLVVLLLSGLAVNAQVGSRPLD